MIRNFLVIAVILFILINFLTVQYSLAIAVPDGVYAPKEGGYVFADYPDVFDGFGNDGLTIELWFCITDFPKDPKEEWILIDKPQSFIISIAGKESHLPDDIACELKYMTYSGKNGKGGSGSFLLHEMIGEPIYFVYMMRGKGPVFYAEFLNGRSGGMGEHNSFVEGFWASDDPLFIGGRDGHNSIRGWIDDVRISKGWLYTPFRSFEPEQRFEVGKNTLAIWHFDEGNDSNFYKDSSGNQYTLFAGVGTTAVDSKTKLATTWGRLKR